MKRTKTIRTFNPARVARLETENWEAYYQKRWGRLLQVSVGMVQEAFGLNILQALQLSQRCTVLFSPSHEELAARELADWILADQLPVRFQIQLHKYLWGNVPGK